MIGQAHLETFLCRERAAGEDNLGGLRPAEHARQNQVPPDSGTVPRLTNAAANFALSAMMRMSQPSAVSMPELAAAPLRAQIVGFSMLNGIVGGAVLRSGVVRAPSASFCEPMPEPLDALDTSRPA